MKRCTKTKKRKFADAGHAAEFVWPGEYRGLYLCDHCGYYHLTKRRQLQISSTTANAGASRPAR